MCHRAAGHGHTCPRRPHPARPARPLPPARPHLDTPGCPHRSRRPRDSREASPAPRAARRVPSRRGVREAHLIVAAGAGARGRARGAGRGALAGEPAPGAAAPRLAGLRGAAGVHFLGASVRAASCGDGLGPRRLTAGPRPLPSWRARARAGVCARRRGRWKEGRGRRPPDPLTERRRRIQPQARDGGCAPPPAEGVRARASLRPRPLRGERARRSKPDTKGAGPHRPRLRETGAGSREGRDLEGRGCDRWGGTVRGGVVVGGAEP